jgi:hypothetical protein
LPHIFRLSSEPRLLTCLLICIFSAKTDHFKPGWSVYFLVSKHRFLSGEIMFPSLYESPLIFGESIREKNGTKMLKSGLNKCRQTDIIFLTIERRRRWLLLSILSASRVKKKLNFWQFFFVRRKKKPFCHLFPKPWCVKKKNF